VDRDADSDKATNVIKTNGIVRMTASSAAGTPDPAVTLADLLTFNTGQSVFIPSPPPLAAIKANQVLGPQFALARERADCRRFVRRFRERSAAEGSLLLQHQGVVSSRFPKGPLKTGLSWLGASPLPLPGSNGEAVGSRRKPQSAARASSLVR
jgi:hypothetical protein